MAIFKRLGKSDLFGTFTHYATLHGVPIYYGDDGNQVAVRNWYPEWLLDVATFIDDTLASLATLVNPCYDHQFKIKIGDPIFKTPIYVTCPGHIRSIGDGDSHFITHGMLRYLYNVRSSNYKCVESISQVGDWSKFEFITLNPRYDGDYTLPKPIGDFIYY